MQQAQACGEGQRDKQRKLVGGCEILSGGQHTSPGEEVGRECDREVL